ncbi:hypothetical protein [Danxiaibacter flavus]
MMDKAVVEKLREVLMDQTKERLVLEILLLCSGDKEIEADFKKRYFPRPPKPSILSDEQISAIAEGIDMGNVFYVNLETRETEEMFSDEHLSLYGISIEDDEEEEDDDEKDDQDDDDDDDDDDEPNRDLPDWQNEMEEDVRKQVKRIKSWKSSILIKAPGSHIAYNFMQLFVTRRIPENKQQYFEDTLQGRKPFARFNHAIHNSAYREDWFAFKKQMMMQYVKDCLDEAAGEPDEGSKGE